MATEQLKQIKFFMAEEMTEVLDAEHRQTLHEVREENEQISTLGPECMDRRI